MTGLDVEKVNGHKGGSLGSKRWQYHGETAQVSGKKMEFRSLWLHGFFLKKSCIYFR